MRAAAGVLLIVSSLILNACGGRSSSPTALVTDENGLTTIATDDFPSDFALTLTQVTVTGNDATVEFTTGVEARVWIEYGKNSYTENKRTAPTTGVTHTLTLTALEKGRYFFKIGAVSLDDTQKSAWGGNLDASFLIASASLAQISNIQTTTQGEATTITFNTDIAAQASIDVGLTTAYDLLTESESGFTKTHSITVSLPQMGTFYYRIRLVDDAGDTKTDDNAGAGYTFTRANSEPLGSKLNPIVIDTTPLASNTVVNYNHSATTTGAASNYISSYAPYTNAGSYAAPEVIYTFTVGGSVKFKAAITGDGGGVDNDVQLLTALTVDGSGKATLFNNVSSSRGDTQIAEQTIPAGTYYVTVDAYKPPSAAAKVGSFTFTVDLENTATPVGTASNPILIDPASPYTDTRNTSNSTSKIFNTYPGYAQNESGPEFIYVFTLTETKRVTATLSGMVAGVDIDIHLLDSITLPLSAAHVLARDDKTLTRELNAGTYYLVADTYVNASGERKGAYTLNVTFTAVTPATPGSLLVGGGTSGGADGIVTITNDDTPPLVKATGKKLHPTRQLTLDIARTYVGRISDLGGTGGNKLGWELLKDIYDTSYHTNVFSWGQTAIDGIKLPGKKINSWCGIFAVAMVRKAGVDAANWQTGIGPKGIASSCKANDGNFTPGDILVMKGSLVHHNLFVSQKTDGSMVTIDGNQVYQTVKLRTNLNASDVQCYYTPLTEKYVDE